MSDGWAKRWPLEQAYELGTMIVATLAPACTRIEIAGSIRRRVTRVKDVELVAVPRYRLDLFGDVLDEPHALDRLVDEYIASGHLARRLDSAGRPCMGSRHKRLTDVLSGIAIDLFAVLPPAQWGTIFAIRTGPAEYSEHLVTNCKRRGLRCVDGRLLTPSNREVSTPEEIDFIRECGVPFEEPWRRR